MKKFIITLSLLLMTAIGFAQTPVMDSIQIYTAIPEKPVLVDTVATYDELFPTMSAKADEMGVNEFIVVFFYKEDKDAPQKQMSKAYKRNAK